MMIFAVGQKGEPMLKVPYGQDPYSVIGKYIRDHITAIEDIIAVIEIGDITINQLFLVDMNEENYFIWDNDWYEGEKDVALIDFFPVSEAINPSAQPDGVDLFPDISEEYKKGYRDGLRDKPEPCEYEVSNQVTNEYLAPIRDYMVRCGDAVSRADVVDMLEMYPFTEYNEYEAAREVVKRLPSVQPERKKGEWIKHMDDLYPAESTIECSICHHHQPLTIDDNYCPNCGSDNREK